MASRKPLVLNNGMIEQLQSGDVLDAVVTEVDIYTMTNESGTTINIGMPVYADGANTAAAAQADAAASSRVIGIMQDETANEATGNVQTSGVFTATTGDWDVLTGGSGGLTAGATYFLSDATAGGLTTTAPTASGNFYAKVGVALTATSLSIDPEHPIKL